MGKEKARHGKRQPREWQGLLIEMSYTTSVRSVYLQSGQVGPGQGQASYL